MEGMPGRYKSYPYWQFESTDVADWIDQIDLEETNLSGWPKWRIQDLKGSTRLRNLRKGNWKMKVFAGPNESVEALPLSDVAKRLGIMQGDLGKIVKIPGVSGNVIIHTTDANSGSVVNLKGFVDWLKTINESRLRGLMNDASVDRLMELREGDKDLMEVLQG